jgi:hydrogenase nickel incorporation protein HypA/HybF
MHELALSESIVRTVLDACGTGPASVRKKSVRKIGLEVGLLSAVNVSSLEFCMQAMLEQSGMEQVEVEIKEVPARVECACGGTYEATDMFTPCPECGGFARRVVGGTDVTIQYVEVEDEQDQAGTLRPAEQ